MAMRLGGAGATVILGMIVAAAAVAGGPIAAHAQVTCTQGTAALVRAVGPSSAPMLVPAQVHVTICSDNGNVVAVIPAFQTVGPAGAPMIIPTSTQVRTCAPTVVAATPTSGGGLTPALQFSQVGSGVVTVPVIGGGTVVLPTATSSSATTMTVTSFPTVVTVVPTVVTSTPTAFTCF
jgi:hypothetical protein